VPRSRHGPRGGSRLLRIALADVRDGARSAAEATAARRLARGRIPPFELNVPVVDEDGRLVSVVDVLWRELRAALEIDSREYHFAEKDWEATMRRHNALTRSGLAVAHYPPRLVTARNSTFVAETAEWLRRAHRRTGRPDAAGAPGAETAARRNFASVCRPLALIALDRSMSTVDMRSNRYFDQADFGTRD
jgi:hypothetical protein